MSFDSYKRLHKYDFLYESFEQASEENSYNESPCNEIEVTEALKTLLPQEREIVSLFVFGGLKQTEIAEIMNLSYMKVRSKYGYAMKKLKKYYLKEG